MIPAVAFNQLKKEAHSPYKAKWVLVKGSSLKVAGSTNINKFVCEITDYSTPDTIIVYNTLPDKLLFPAKGSLHLPVTDFNCHNIVMTSDLCKTLKAKQFPVMGIHFISLSKFPDLKFSEEAITGLVNIELAGTSKYFPVSYSVYKDAKNTIHLIGRRGINFADFKLTPPRKLGGMIKTKEELEVEFHLVMKALN